MKKIYLVEDHHIVRHGIKKMLAHSTDLQVIGESDNAEETLDELKTLDVDLVITDITMEGMNGIEFTKQVKNISGGAIKVLILSMHADELYINQCFDAGANGYLLKDFKHNELTNAIQKILNGEKFISRTASQVLANNYINKEYSGKYPNSVKLDLTKRQREIVELISHGYSNKEIAEKFSVSVSTINAHRYNILKKLEVKNTAEMIAKAVKMKLISIQ
jgi:DNA-binding NarL/FixJ family response regulator